MTTRRKLMERAAHAPTPADCGPAILSAARELARLVEQAIVPVSGRLALNGNQGDARIVEEHGRVLLNLAHDLIRVWTPDRPSADDMVRSLVLAARAAVATHKHGGRCAPCEDLSNALLAFGGVQ